MTHRDSQLELFAIPPPATQTDPEVAALAERLPPLIKFGTCSWTFEGWRGEVFHRTYSSKKSFAQTSLAEYAAYPLFRTAEIDSTYYAPANAQRLADYADILPEGFPCAMKAWQEITTMVFPNHPRFAERAGLRNPNFLDPDALTEHVLAPIESSFSSHIGPILLCIPPAGAHADPAAFEKRLALFLSRAPSGYQYAFELRDRVLFTRRYLSILRDHGAVHIFNYWSNMPSIAEQRTFVGSALGSVVVARLMLPPNKRYDDQKAAMHPFDRIVEEQSSMRQDVVDLLRDTLDRAVPVYVYANNKAEGSAPLTIRAIARALLA